MSVYDINRVAPVTAGDVPNDALSNELRDDRSDIHFVPAPCQVACPIGTDAPSYIAHIWEGRIAEAYEAITATNPFSSICGRVCDAPCEPACRRADSDGAIAIRNLKRFVMDKLGRDFHAGEAPVTRRESVAVVGAGPAGLTAAQDLAEAGFAVHVYEMTDRPGGMMVWGIPAFRLPPGVVEEDMARLFGHCPGITLHTNCALGREVTLDALKERHDAVLLTIGAWWGKGMAIPGAEGDARVIDGVGFLRRVNAGERPSLPETVLVIGGGDVAMDACRVAKRLPGCREVKVVYRRGPEEIPARRDELEGALREDIEFVYNVQPVAVIADDTRFALRCVRTELGEPDADGRRRPINVEGSEFEIDCGMVILATGQEARCEELDRHGLMAGDRVRADLDTMRTDDAKVFAAGDGAFGGSTIVQAMYHGHRAAYYVKAFLDGRENPLPYRTPYRTRRVPIAQDPDWEVIPRQEQPFHGLGDDPVAFPEIESTYTDREARVEAARCYRCDAETGSADYNVQNREDIFLMARADPADTAFQRAILRKRLRTQHPDVAGEHPPTLDDLVFLPANLSRLVIDPYRDACNTRTVIGGEITVEAPFVVTGFDAAPEEVRAGLAEGLRRTSSAYLGQRALADDIPWLQVLARADDRPSETARALVHVFRDDRAALDARRLAEGQHLGLVATGRDLRAAIPRALDAGFDFLILDGTGSGRADGWPELAAASDLTPPRDAIAILRAMNREEDIDLLYFGGVRSGTDAAKLIALGCRATVLGVSMALAIGGRIEGDRIAFSADRDDDERAASAARFIEALSGEASIMARCTGKTDVHNLEPEDLRAITLATARAVAVPLAGTTTPPGD